MATLLDALTRRCVQFESASPPGRNTVITTHISPEEWVEWEDFTYAQIMSAFGRPLSKPYPGAKEPKPLSRDLAIYDETALDLALWHFRFPVINSALSEMDQAPYYARGALAPLRGSKFKPDWCCVSDHKLSQDGQYLGLLLGDSKLHSKWQPEYHDPGRRRLEHAKFNEWQRVMSQIVSYSVERHVRYGFIVTDTEVVVLRFSRQVIAAGRAVDRPRRAVVANATQSFSSDVSMQSADRTRSSTESYKDDNPANAEYNIEHRVIPWAVHGQRLTAKLALWALAMMATNGDSYLAEEYPGIDTWRTALATEGGGFRHNTTGDHKATRGDRRIEEPAGAATFEEHFVYFDDNNDDAAADDDDGGSGGGYGDYQDYAGEPRAPEQPDQPLHMDGVISVTLTKKRDALTDSHAYGHSNGSDLSKSRFSDISSQTNAVYLRMHPQSQR